MPLGKLSWLLVEATILVDAYVDASASVQQQVRKADLAVLCVNQC